MTRIILVPTILIVFIAMTYAPGAYAEDRADPEKPWKRFSLNMGANFALSNSNVRLGTQGVGVGVDVEELLGLETRTTSFKVDGYWRFMKRRRHRLDFSWFSTRRSGENTLGRPIEVGDIIVDPGTTFNTTLNIDIFQVGYSYSFFQDERFDLAVGAGAFILPISFEFGARGAGGSIDEFTSESITAPLPVFNLRGDFAITPKWFLRTKVQLFYLELGEFRGGITDVNLGLEYMVFRNVGFGLNVEKLDLLVEAEGGDYPGVDFVGRFEFDYLGAMLYLKFYFGK